MTTNGKDLILSAIDLQWPGYISELAPLLDQLGYHRLWLTEHHSGGQSGSPIVMAAVAAAITRRIRVGTAGVMLRYYSPFKVAEDFHLLNLLFPGRIDLGVIGGKSNHQGLDDALGNGRVSNTVDYRGRVKKLVSLVERGPDADPELRRFICAAEGSRPELWVCSLSVQSAVLAATQGMAFAYNLSLCSASQQRAGLEVLARYRSEFRPVAGVASPQAVLVCYGTCAETEGEARRIWRARFGAKPADPAPVGDATFIGDPQQCRSQLEALASEYCVNEVVVQQIGGDWEARARGYQLLSEALSLDCRHVTTGGSIPLPT